ncbi:hypothetical protein ACFQH2_13710 [Natronoarchaeum sp. GCM10025703]|uniref:DUF7289 family protein n=1 Tax=Natronoarchaeum sp. GCM10025703 TaxID=3252685 RepID=UPI0036115B83
MRWSAARRAARGSGLPGDHGRRGRRRPASRQRAAAQRQPRRYRRELGTPHSAGTDVTHERQSLGTDSYRIAVETSTPGPWKRYFEDVGATVETTDRAFPGDRETSVVARIDGDRTAYLVTHDLRLEVGYG